jgi:CRP-like cAMP-binding protein
MVRIETPAGQAVINEGESGDRFYVIDAGLVAILKSSPSSAPPVEVNRLGPGSYFGETALLRDIPRTATVTAVTDLVLYALDCRPFLEAVTRSPLSTDEAERVIDRRASNAEPTVATNPTAGAANPTAGSGNPNAESG